MLEIASKCCSGGFWSENKIKGKVLRTPSVINQKWIALNRFWHGRRIAKTKLWLKVRAIHFCFCMFWLRTRELIVLLRNGMWKAFKSIPQGKRKPKLPKPCVALLVCIVCGRKIVIVLYLCKLIWKQNTLSIRFPELPLETVLKAKGVASHSKNVSHHKAA